jgi:hypothetical protein
MRDADEGAATLFTQMYPVWTFSYAFGMYRQGAPNPHSLDREERSNRKRFASFGRVDLFPSKPMPCQRLLSKPVASARVSTNGSRLETVFAMHL